VTHGDAKIGINSSIFPRDGLNPEIVSPCVTQRPKNDLSRGNPSSYSGDASHDSASPSDDDIAFAVGHPKYATPAQTPCTVCGVTDDTCSHARRKR
jgi:hypothetical protein